MKGHIEVTLDEQERTELMDELYESVGGAMLDRIIDIVMHQYELRVCAGCSNVISTLPGSRQGVLLHAEGRTIGAYCVDCVPGAVQPETLGPVSNDRYSDLLSIIAWQAAQCEVDPVFLPDEAPEFVSCDNPWSRIFDELPGLQEKFTDKVQTIRRRKEAQE